MQGTDLACCNQNCGKFHAKRIQNSCCRQWSWIHQVDCCCRAILYEGVFASLNALNQRHSSKVSALAAAEADQSEPKRLDWIETVTGFWQSCWLLQKPKLCSQWEINNERKKSCWQSSSRVELTNIILRLPCSQSPKTNGISWTCEWQIYNL